MKYHPLIIKDLYPKLALVIIKFSGAIISTQRKFILVCKFIFLCPSNSRFPFGDTERHGFQLLLASCLLMSYSCTHMVEAEFVTHDDQKIQNQRGRDRFSGLSPWYIVFFIKVTLTVSTTHINYFISPLTLPKFFLHFNRGDLVGGSWSMEPVSGA